MIDLTTTPLNPAQQQVQDTLGATADQRPTFREELREELRDQLETSIHELLHDKIDLPLFIAKHGLNLIHGCEARYVAELDTEFAWTVPIARGTIAHKAIELLIGRRGNPTPLDLIEDALARLESEQRPISRFLNGLTEADRAQLISEANDVVATFVETFPPLKRRWMPVCESRIRAELCDDNITMAGKIDLSLGQATGTTAGKVIIDLKTGKPRADHIGDLRFYALLETLKVGVPPRLLVNYYLESGTPRCEPVTEDTIWSTARRLVDGIEKQIELTQQQPRTPLITPGVNCRWCPALTTCDSGQIHLAEQQDYE